MYREEPDYDDNSGWRFTTGNETDKYMDDTNNSPYVSLGAVLREDDSCLQLLEREAGVAFVKDEKVTSLNWMSRQIANGSTAHHLHGATIVNG